MTGVSGPRTEARFRSGDGECEASIFRPAASDDRGLLPIVVLAHGLAGVKSLRLDTYADERRFFSFRRATHRGEPGYGRQISLIALPN